MRFWVVESSDGPRSAWEPVVVPTRDRKIADAAFRKLERECKAPEVKFRVIGYERQHGDSSSRVRRRILAEVAATLDRVLMGLSVRESNREEAGLERAVRVVREIR